MAIAPSFGAVKEASDPLNEPTGVLTPLTITTSSRETVEYFLSYNNNNKTKEKERKRKGFN
mgnify:CR=1 FL=1